MSPPVGDSLPSAKTNLILHSSMPSQEEAVDACIHKLAQELRSDVVVLTAQDLAQLGGDYLGEGPEPTPRSIRSLGYETYRLNAVVRGEDIMEAAEQKQERDDIQELGLHSLPGLSIPGPLGILFSEYKSGTDTATNAGVLGENAAPATNQNETQLEDMKLAALLDVLIDASEAKQSHESVGTKDSATKSEQLESRHKPGFFDYSVYPESAGLELNSALPILGPGETINMVVSLGSSPPNAHIPAPSKIIYVKDFKEMNATPYGGRLLQKLEELVRKRRLVGESIMIIGSTCSRALTPQLSARYVTSSRHIRPTANTKQRDPFTTGRR